MRARDVVINVAGASIAAAVVVVVIAALPAPRGSAGGPSPDSTAAPTPRPTLAARPSDQPCRTSLQAEVDAATPGAVLDLRGCTYTSGATIDKPLTIVGAIVEVPPGEAGITVSANDVTLDGIELIGSQAATFVFEEIGVFALATPAAPIRRLTIRDSTIATFGGFGTYLRNVADVHVVGNEVTDVVYSGIMVLSGKGGTIEANTVRRIGVVGSEANSGNAYGIVLTTQGTKEPPSSDFLVTRNTVEDVPTWHAFDTHGGRRLVFSDNTVRRSPRPFFITTDKAGNQPTSITISGNQILSPAPIDTNLAAVTLYRAQAVAIIGNTASGWNEASFLRDFEDQSTRVVVSDNTIVP